MLSCKEVAQQHASDYLDGRLPAKTRLGIAMHLSLCNNCRRFIKQLKLVRQVIQNHRIPESESSDLQALAAKLQVEHSDR